MHKERSEKEIYERDRVDGLVVMHSFIHLFVSLLVESATCEIIKKNKHLEGFIEIVNAPTREFAFGEPNL